MHEVVKALRIVRSKAEIFVEIEGSSLGEIEAGVFVKRGEVFVHPQGGAARCKTENDGRIGADRARDDAGGFLSDLFGVLFENYEHFCVELRFSCLPSGSNMKARLKGKP